MLNKIAGRAYRSKLAPAAVGEAGAFCSAAPHACNLVDLYASTLTVCKDTLKNSAVCMPRSLPPRGTLTQACPLVMTRAPLLPATDAALRCAWAPPEQTRPTSWLCLQLCRPMLGTRQSMSCASSPWQSTSSSQIWPVPAGKLAVVVGGMHSQVPCLVAARCKVRLQAGQAHGVEAPLTLLPGSQPGPTPLFSAPDPTASRSPCPRQLPPAAAAHRSWGGCWR